MKTQIILVLIIKCIICLPLIPVTHICSDQKCETCLQADPTACVRCTKKTFLHNHRCLLTCPLNTFADLFLRKCLPTSKENKDNHFFNTKAYSLGSCENICGKNIISDCSCDRKCILKGDCCSDYSSSCENLYTNNLLFNCHSMRNNCLLCFSNTQCGQCEKGYWLRNGECVKQCYQSDIEKTSNKVCTINRQCHVSNCDECEKNDGFKCLKCQNGYFYYKNQCVKQCPSRTLADRLSWSCMDPHQFAFYWIYPSHNSCRGTCGREMIRDNLDCSCNEKCFQKGNCCGDIEQFCPEYIYWK